MPIETMFARNTDAIRRFLTDRARTLMVLTRDADLEVVIKKLLVKLDDTCERVIMVACEVPFVEPASWCEGVMQRLSEAQEPLRGVYQRGGVRLASVPVASRGRGQLAGQPQAPAQVQSPAQRLAAYLAASAEAIAPVSDAMAVVIVPKSVADFAAFQRTLCFLADNIPSTRVKLIVPDDRSKPGLPRVGSMCRRGFVHPFHVPPEAMQAELEHDLSPQGELGALMFGAASKLTATSAATPAATSAATAASTAAQLVKINASKAMLAGFLSSSGRLGEAAAIQVEQLEQAKAGGDVLGEAQALYNLGTTRLKQHHYADAEAMLDRAVELSFDSKRDPLLAMSLTNLGVAFERQRKGEQAVQAFDLARAVFRRMSHPPGEAHVLDCKAGALASLGLHEAARESWREARRLYEGITAPALADVRSAGREDIDQKLARHENNPAGYTPRPTPVNLEISALARAGAGGGAGGGGGSRAIKGGGA